MTNKKLPLIKVTSGRNDSKVVLHETHSDHPDGEVFLSQPNKVISVAETSHILGLLSRGWLIKVEAKSRKSSGKSSSKDIKELK